jgi:hypothetical protein
MWRSGRDRARVQPGERAPLRGAGLYLEDFIERGAPVARITRASLVTGLNVVVFGGAQSVKPASDALCDYSTQPVE